MILLQIAKLSSSKVSDLCKIKLEKSQECVFSI